MYTIQQVADYINTNKPDFKEFKELFNPSSMEFYKIKNNIDLTKSMEEKLFKAQILACFYATHNNYYLNGEAELFLGKILYDNLKDSKVRIRTGIYKRYNFDRISYVTIGQEFNNNLILAHVLDIQNYIPRYLWNKVRIKTAITDIKQLKPDGFSLVTFKNYLEGLKKEMPSSQAINYLEQVNRFPLEIKQQYIEVLVEHLSQPSWEFQEHISGYSLTLYDYAYIKGLAKFKHIGLSRYYIKSLVQAHSLLVPQSVMDNLDSAYKPFVTGIKRKPTTDMPQFTALVGTLIVLKTALKQNSEIAEIYTYFIEEIEKHLKDPAYDEVKAKYAQTLKNTKESIEEVLNGSI